MWWYITNDIYYYDTNIISVSQLILCLFIHLKNRAILDISFTVGKKKMNLPNQEIFRWKLRWSHRNLMRGYIMSAKVSLKRSGHSYWIVIYIRSCWFYSYVLIGNCMVMSFFPYQSELLRICIYHLFNSDEKTIFKKKENIQKSH